MSNLKFEPTASGARAARLGKVPQDMLRPLLKEYGVNFINSWREYPGTQGIHQTEVQIYEDVCFY